MRGVQRGEVQSAHGLPPAHAAPARSNVQPLLQHHKGCMPAAAGLPHGEELTQVMNKNDAWPFEASRDGEAHTQLCWAEQCWSLAGALELSGCL